MAAVMKPFHLLTVRIVSASEAKKSRIGGVRPTQRGMVVVECDKEIVFERRWACKVSGRHEVHGGHCFHVESIASC